MPDDLQVGVVIPSHNGSATIIPLLTSLVNQVAEGYRLLSITVACDGCTDDTAALVAKFALNHPNVSLIDDGQRLGKPGRLNRFFEQARADLLVSMDDDLILGSNHTLAELVDCFRDEGIGLAGGHDTPLPPRNLCQKILFASDLVWHEIRREMNGGDSIHNNPGRCMALRREVYKHVNVPDTSGDDEYIYLRTKQLGYGFAFATRARCHYRLPHNLTDAFLQSSRHLRSKQDVFDALGPECERAYAVPTALKAKTIVRLLPGHGIFVPLALLFQISLRLFAAVYRWRPGEGIYERIGRRGALAP